MDGHEGYHRLKGGWRPSQAQQRVLDGLAEGDSNPRIAARLGLSAETVKWHVAELLAETGCADRAALATWWRARQRRRALALLLALWRHRALAGLAASAAVAAVVALLLVASRGPASRQAAAAIHRSPTPSVQHPAAATNSDQDVGLFVLHQGGALQPDNRAAASAATLAAGDLVQFPAGMRWDPPPGVSVSPTTYLMASMAISGRKLYITVYTNGGGVRFEQIDERTFRVTQGGTVLITAQDRGADGGMTDHPVAVDAAGHLHLDPAPVAGNVVAIYGSGQGLDVRGMTVAGRLPPTHASYPSEWFFTMCDAGRCELSYRTRQVIAPVAGTVVCQQGAEFDFDTGSYRLQFRDAGTLRNNPTWQGAPGTCGVGRAAWAGDVIAESFAHYIVSAVSESGQPLSIVVAYDGTLYVGQLTTPDPGHVGRGT